MNAEEHRAAAENLLGDTRAARRDCNFALAGQLSREAQVHATLATNLPADAAALSAAQGRIAQLEGEVRGLRNRLDALRGERDTALAQLAGGQP